MPAQDTTASDHQEILILDMTLLGHYPDGSPTYRFSTKHPTWGVRLVAGVYSTPEIAYLEAKYVLSWLEEESHGFKGDVLGVTAAEGGYRGVVNTRRLEG